MKWRTIVFMAGVLVFLLSRPVASEEWVDLKNSAELRALYSNKTFKGTFYGVPVVEHYRADGKGIYISAELRRPCTWDVQGNDQVCVSDETGTNCYRFKRSKENPAEYVRTNAKTTLMAIIKVEDGVPTF